MFANREILTLRQPFGGRDSGSRIVRCGGEGEVIGAETSRLVRKMKPGAGWLLFCKLLCGSKQANVL